MYSTLSWYVIILEIVRPKGLNLPELILQCISSVVSAVLDTLFVVIQHEVEVSIQVNSYLWILTYVQVSVSWMEESLMLHLFLFSLLVFIFFYILGQTVQYLGRGKVVDMQYVPVCFRPSSQIFYSNMFWNHINCPSMPCVTSPGI